MTGHETGPGEVSLRSPVEEARNLLHGRASELRNATEAFSAAEAYYQGALENEYLDHDAHITAGEVEVTIGQSTETVTASEEKPVHVLIDEVVVEATKDEDEVTRFRPSASGRALTAHSTEVCHASFWLDEATFTLTKDS